ncbi:interleukin-10 [Cheilinus undulatus]|uniref:interleukin-10 n=1 Tax=Cheilinus undulatus TaxID=241271 RepID=UPI001BD3CCC8|nr:interleukin-10 [Cheilinus undulatus]
MDILTFYLNRTGKNQHCKSCRSILPGARESLQLLNQQHLHSPLKAAAMTPRSLLMSVLVLVSFEAAYATPMCNNYCCRFVESFPVRLRRLRQDYSQIRDFYEANDDLDTALLDQSVENSFKTDFACHAMDSILDFYLSTVLPTALAGVTDEIRDLMPHVESIQQIFDALKSDVTQCRHYFSCKTQFDIKTLNSTYTQMESKGLYKAMGELDVLFNYIEVYLASKRHRNKEASARS